MNESFSLTQLEVLCEQSEAALEGFNLDMRKEYKNSMKFATASIKQAKKYAKEGKVDDVKSELNATIKYLKDSYNEFQEIAKKGTLTTTLVGNILHSLVFIGDCLDFAIRYYFIDMALYAMAPFLTYPAGPRFAGAVGVTTIGLRDMFELSNKLLTAASGKKMSAADWNLYVGDISRCYTYAINSTTQVRDKLVKKAQKKKAKLDAKLKAIENFLTR